MSEETQADAFLAQPAGRPARGGDSDVRNGRYQVADPETGEARSWTRASNMAEPIVDRFAIERSRLRRVLWGAGRRPDVMRVLETMTEFDGSKLDELAATALEVSGSSEASNQGTAIHAVQLRADRGMDVPEGMELYVAGYQACLERHGLTPVVREARVANRALGAMGRVDGLYREADGTLVVGDTKGTDYLELAAPEWAPQLFTYATAEWIELEGDGNGWTRTGPVRTDYAVVFHVDRQTGATSAYRVDLIVGGHGAQLAMMVRDYRRAGRSVLLPYVAPSAVPTGVPVAPSAVPTGVPVGTASDLRDVVVPMEPVTGATLAASGVALLTAVQLQKLTKAQVQQYLRDHGRPDDLAHQKGLLISRAIQAGLVLGLQDQGQQASPVGAGAWQPPRLDDPAVLPGMPDPRVPAFRDDVLRKIAAAETVAELSTVNRYVVRIGGDQAWTDEYAELARARAATIDAGNPHHALKSRVVACQSVEDVATLWDEATVGGSNPDGWPDEVQEAARRRLAEIEAATPPAPANPFRS